MSSLGGQSSRIHRGPHYSFPTSRSNIPRSDIPPRRLTSGIPRTSYTLVQAMGNPRKRIYGRHQPIEPNTDAESLELLQKRAQEEYPNDDPLTAFRKYIIWRNEPGVFYVGENGERMIRGPAIQYLHSPWDDGRFWTSVWPDNSRNRRFRWPKTAPTLKSVNTPKKGWIAKLIAHPSESQWDRPTGHKYHWYQLPLEIQRLILKFVVTLPNGEDRQCLQPITVTCNWNSEFCAIGNDIKYLGSSDYQSELLEPMAFSHQSDEFGRYCLVRPIIKATIDATLLRVPDFHELGTEQLYGSNLFIFSMTSDEPRSQPPTLRNKREIHHPCARKPFFNPERSLSSRGHLNPMGLDEWNLTIKAGVKQIVEHRSVFELDGWIYYDPFLRFLHTIGPKNAAMIKKVCFEGIVKLHSCGPPQCRSRCSHELHHSLRLYIPFMVALLPKLEHLVLCTPRDYNQGGEHFEDEHGNINAPFHVEVALRPILENELRAIKSLKTLEVLDFNEQQEPSRPTWKFAEQSVEWFASTYAQRRSEEAVAQHSKSQSITEAVGTNVNTTTPTVSESSSTVKTNMHENGLEVVCDFCGEGHIWPECYNLCNFCGEYGHQRNDCKRWGKSRAD